MPDNEIKTRAATRREFLKKAGLVSAGLVLGGGYVAGGRRPAGSAASDAGGHLGEMPMRRLGRTGAKVSIIGIGGSHIGDAGSLENARRIIDEAIDNGVTFMDNAWEYHGGRSEEWMGEALQGKRDKVFLMTKVCVHGRDAKVAMEQLEDSLRRLKTDHLDLWQIHEVIKPEEPGIYFRPGGAVEALDKAKQQGKVRFVGFTGHKDPAIHLKMLSHKYAFDTCQMPLNCFDASHATSFEKQVLPELKRQRIAALGMKSLAGNAAPINAGAVTLEQALHYAMSLPVATVISGIDSVDKLRQNVQAARGFKQMSQSGMDALRKRCLTYAESGKFEYYKA